MGLIASRSLVVALLAARGRPDRAGDVRLLVGFVMAVWVVAAVVGVFGPEIVSGSDPTHIPICAVLAPIAAMVLTTTAGQLFTSLDERRAQP